MYVYVPSTKLHVSCKNGFPSDHCLLQGRNLWVGRSMYVRVGDIFIVFDSGLRAHVLFFLSACNGVKKKVAQCIGREGGGYHRGKSSRDMSNLSHRIGRITESGTAGFAADIHWGTCKGKLFRGVDKAYQYDQDQDQDSGLRRWWFRQLPSFARSKDP